MPSDFRSDPMDSPEGKGRARRAWDAYANAVNKPLLPLLKPAIHAYARKWTMDQIGFWVAWHMYGGFEGLVEHAGMHPSTVWRKVAKFREYFGVHPDVYRMPGVTLDPEAFWAAATEAQAATLAADADADADAGEG